MASFSFTNQERWVLFYLRNRPKESFNIGEVLQLIGEKAPIESMYLVFNTLKEFKLIDGIDPDSVSITSDGIEFVDSNLNTFYQEAKHYAEIDDNIDQGTESYETTENETNDQSKDPKSIPNILHDAVFQNLVSYKEKNKSFVFWLRERNTNNRLNNGFWFQGTENYAHVGFYNARSGNRSTKSIGFVFWPHTSATTGLTFEVLYRYERDENLLVFYEWLRDLMKSDYEKEFEDLGADRFKVLLSLDDPYPAAFNFLDKYRDSFDDKVRELGLESIFIPEAEFVRKLGKIIEKREAIFKNIELQQDEIIDDTDELEGDQEMEKSSPFLSKNAHLNTDNPSEEDELERKGLVKLVASRIDEILKKPDMKDSYTMLLNGKWGTGKSTMLLFFEEELTGKGWQVIRYNAWENQDAKDPWWNLVSKISKLISDRNRSNQKIESHEYWIFKLKYKHRLSAFLLLLTFVISAYFFVNGDVENGSISFYSSIVGLITTILAAITGIANNFFYQQVNTAKLMEQYTDNPFKKIKERFEIIANENRLAVFIDDMDRCSVDSTVKLLEGIQNLFKGAKVLYIIAADGRWVSQCFNAKYETFVSLGKQGHSIGDDFLQKSFQLILNVPKIDFTLQSIYLKRILRPQALARPEQLNAKKEQQEDLIKKIEKVESEKELETVLEAMPNELNVNIRSMAAEKFERIVDEKNDHYLEQFLKFIPPNPRLMKRMLNQYVITKQSIIFQNKSTLIDEEALVRYVIFFSTWPTFDYQIREGQLNIADIQEKNNITEIDKERITTLLGEFVTDEMIRAIF